MLNMGQMGRYGDNTMAHVSTGEMIVPQEVLDKRPDLKTGIMAALSQEGLNPDRYTVGSGINSINPTTGQPEFFNLKKLIIGSDSAFKADKTHNIEKIKRKKIE